jgi:exopolysaccharide biosynthesis polyprenyl glycosylphosphotransferase
MTTSSPVVARLGNVVKPRARYGQAGFYRYRPNTRPNLWALSDLVSIVLAVALLRRSSMSFVPDSLHTVAGRFLAAPLIGASACILLFWMLGVYSPPASPLNIYETEQLLRSTSIIALVTILGGARLDLRLVLTALGASCFITLLLIAQRGLVRHLLPSCHEQIRALIYARDVDKDLFTIIHTISVHTITLVGLVCDSPWELSRRDEMPCRFAGTWNQLKQIAKQTSASHVLVVGGDPASRETNHVLQKCGRLKLQCAVLMDPRNLSTTHPAYTFMHELPVLQQRTVGVRAPFLHLKRAIDLVVGSCLLIAALPIAVLIAAVIKYDSPGPVLFRQERIGKDRQPFELLKFRTMHVGSPKYHRSPISNLDSRITRIGRLLRRLSLDELPQLLNVLKGDMSLVGPRPEMPFIVDQYSDAALARLAVLPGITGLWQISRSRSLPIHHNLQYDLFYIERHSIFLDAAILLRTFGAVVKGVGAA